MNALQWQDVFLIRCYVLSSRSLPVSDCVDTRDVRETCLDHAALPPAQRGTGSPEGRVVATHAQS